MWHVIVPQTLERVIVEVSAVPEPIGIEIVLQGAVTLRPGNRFTTAGNALDETSSGVVVCVSSCSNVGLAIRGSNQTRPGLMSQEWSGPSQDSAPPAYATTPARTSARLSLGARSWLDGSVRRSWRTAACSRRRRGSIARNLSVRAALESFLARGERVAQRIAAHLRQCLQCNGGDMGGAVLFSRAARDSDRAQACET